MPRFEARSNVIASQVIHRRGRGRRRKNPAPGAVVTSSVPVVRPASLRANVGNRAGGRSFQMSDKMEFITAMLCGLIRGNKGKNPRSERMYETEDARMKRLANLVPTVGAEFVAKCALAARIQHGLRSISHWLAAIIAPHTKGEQWAAKFYNQVCVRPDDPLQIIAAHLNANPARRKVTKNEKLRNGTTRKVTREKVILTNPMRKGFAACFGKWDAYRLAKYQGLRNPSLKGLMKLVHPTPTAKNKAALAALHAGELKNVDTWEARLSEAGNLGKSKGEVWAELINEGVMGQLGLLRNLRNIATSCDISVIRQACAQLTDRQAIKKSGILPFQYLTAYQAITEASVHGKEEIKAAIDEAVEIAAENVPSLGTNVLVAIDVSGSMHEFERSNAALFSAVLLKANPHADLMYFANSAKYHSFNRRLPILELQKQIRENMGTGGTDFTQIFRQANKAYDTIVILSDNEGWMSGGAPIDQHAQYKQTFGCDPLICSFDLGGDGSLMFREDGIILLAGFSFHVFKLLNILKMGRKKLTDEIDRIIIGQPLPSYGEDDE